MKKKHTLISIVHFIRNGNTPVKICYVYSPLLKPVEYFPLTYEYQIWQEIRT